MGDYTYEEIYSIVVMQSFSGISLMCIFILMGLGLYIIFGQMGVINMAHAEFLVRDHTLCVFFPSLLQKIFLPLLITISFLPFHCPFAWPLGWGI